MSMLEIRYIRGPSDQCAFRGIDGDAFSHVNIDRAAKKWLLTTVGVVRLFSKADGAI